MELELSNGTLDFEDEVPYKAVPKTAVPFNAEELYSRLADSKGELFYDNVIQEWNQFPVHLDEEKTIMDYLNLLLAAVKKEPGCGALYGTHFLLSLSKSFFRESTIPLDE